MPPNVCRTLESNATAKIPISLLLSLSLACQHSDLQQLDSNLLANNYQVIFAIQTNQAAYSSIGSE